jgi:hypothetical protein
MQKVISIFTLLCCLQTVAQQDTLLYKNHLDYYSPHAKSTVLSKDLKFLKEVTSMEKTIESIKSWF